MNQLIYQQQQNEMQQYMSQLGNASRNEFDLFANKFPVSTDYGTPNPDELLAMKSSLGGMAAQDAGAS